MHIAKRTSAHAGRNQRIDVVRLVTYSTEFTARTRTWAESYVRCFGVGREDKFISPSSTAQKITSTTTERRRGVTKSKFFIHTTRREGKKTHLKSKFSFIEPCLLRIYFVDSSIASQRISYTSIRVRVGNGRRFPRWYRAGKAAAAFFYFYCGINFPPFRFNQYFQ